MLEPEVRDFDFDTVLTRLYKIAKEVESPVELFILGVDENREIFIEPLLDFVASLEDQNLEEVWEETKKYHSVISERQLYIYLAYTYLLDRFPKTIQYVRDLPKEMDPDFLDLILEVIQLYDQLEKSIPGSSPSDRFKINPKTQEKEYFDPPKRSVVEALLNQYRFAFNDLINGKPFKSTMKIADEIIRLQNGIRSEIETPLQRSPIYKTSESIAYDLLRVQEFEDDEGIFEDKEKIGIEDGFFIFEDSVLSEYVPFIQYNTPTKNYYKIFRGKTIEQKPQYKNIIIPPEEKTEPNTIYMKVWVVHPSKVAFEPMHLSDASKFVTVVISLSNGEIKFDIPSIKNNALNVYVNSLGVEDFETYGVDTVSEWVIIDSLKRALPKEIEFGKRKEEDVKAEILVYEAFMDRTSLSYDIFFQNILKHFFYMDENANPQSLQQPPNENKLRFRYAPYPLREKNLPDTIKAIPFITTRIISATIEQSFTKSGETNEVYEHFYDDDGNEEVKISRVVFDRGTPYFRIKVSRTGDTNAIEEFLNNFVYLAQIYMNDRDNVIDYYRPLITEKDAKALFPNPPKQERQQQLFDAKLALKGLQGSNASRHGFTSKNRASAIFRDYIPEWITSNPFRYRDKEYHREVIPFPKPELGDYGTVLLVTMKDGIIQALIQKPLSVGDETRPKLIWIPFDEMINQISNGSLLEPEIWSTCPLEKEPFIGVSSNKNKKSKDIYEYLPVCSASPQTNTTIEGRKATGFQIYYLNLQEEESITRGSILRRSDKICSPSQLGAVPNEIKNKILNLYPEQRENAEFYRYGVSISPNSFLHSVLIALEDPIYFGLDGARKEAYVELIRKYVAARVYPGLLKQSLYDRSLKEIWNMLCDVETFFDPLIYYRAIEEVFGVNVFVYDQETIVLPRHKTFHTQPYRERPTILVIRHWGEDTANLLQPQVELIIENLPGKENVYTFLPSMGRINYDILQQLYKVYTWRIDAKGDLQAYQNRKVGGEYTEPDYSSLIGNNGKYQIVDDYGKMRGLIFKGSRPSTRKGKEIVRKGEPDFQFVTMIFNPSQPVNLPLSTKERLTVCGENQEYEEEMENLPRCDAETAIGIFGTISEITKTLEGEVTGFWFGEALKVYVPIIPTRDPEFLEYPEGEPNPFDVKNDDSVKRLNKMKKDLDTIQQISWWLYTIYSRDTSSSEVGIFSDFVEYYVALDPDYIGDSVNYYNLYGIERVFPEVESVEEAISILQEQEEESLPEGSKRLFENGRVVFYNRHTEGQKGFGDKMLMWLKKRVMLSRSNEKLLNVPTSIRNFYLSSNDFYPQDNVTIFVGIEELKKWLKSIDSEGRVHKIYKKITNELSLSVEPYIFQDSEDGKIYYIQNVSSGSKLRALNVSRYWSTRRINTGWRTPALEESYYPYIVYGDTSDSSSKVSTLRVISTQPVPIKNNIRYDDIPVILGNVRTLNNLRLLQYNTTPPLKYAAMLELL